MARTASRITDMRARLERNRQAKTDVWCRVCVYPAEYECTGRACEGWACDLKLCEGCERELRENGRGDWAAWIGKRVAGEPRDADRRDLELLAADSLLGRFLKGA
jgi:hypothetical protein